MRDLSEQDASSNNGGDSAGPGEVTNGIGEINFFQQGATSTTGSLSLNSDFTDSFLMRGDNIHNYLKDYVAGTQKKLCMAIGYPLASGAGAKNVLLLAARVRSYYNGALGGREYYLQMEAANDAVNSSDCLSVNMNSAIASAFSSSSIAFEIADICPACRTNLASSMIKVFASNGVEVSQILMNNLSLKLLPSTGSGSGPGLTCSTDSVCKVEGYNCCLSGQCVNHGEVKPSVDTSSSEYQSALEQILSRPELIANYTDIFYVCPELVPGEPSEPGTGNPVDPDEQAQELFTELQDLYNCMNPVVDEFSVCTVEAPIQLDKIGNGGTQVSAGIDDITFKDLNGSIDFNNIVNVEYAGRTIYRDQLLPSDIEVAQDSDTVFSATNDTLSTAQSVTVDKTIPSDATKDSIKIRYRVDGTCERLGANLAKCSKYYKQGQISTPARSTDHASGNNNFKLPSYANFSYNIIVEVGGVSVPSGVDTWQANSANREVRFAAQVYNNQEVKITYFVTSNVPSLLESRENAAQRVDTHCNCDPNTSCNLKPVYETINNVNKLVNYACEYGQPDVPEAPLQKTVYISAKTTPHRYYDKDGVHYESDKIGSAQVQEGIAFEYAGQNTLKPNNQSQYVGFNEIYGSFGRTEISAMPATVVDIKKGTNYDIFVDSGAFSSCLNCGNDYFSNLQKLFPANFLHMGAGYLPDMVESRRKSNQGSFSGDDMKFGRACFVPATMIPWTHKANQNLNIQRRNRLAAQHFLFANGYNRDWYGFDYGSLIGSHDGVRWFSIGNQRRIQAKTNKLYLAINAYFGDLTIDNTFKITLSEIASIANAGSNVTHDTDSDGAQCQRAHYCSTDNDCIAQLGYEYTCQSVAGMSTSWPVFDSNGNETQGATELSLLSLVGGSNGQAKRCVYRGAGSICEENLAGVNATDSYSSSDNISLHSCSANTYCASLNQSKFNDRIARYGESPAKQNTQSSITSAVGLSDTFGLGARIIGRPFDFYGSKPAPAGVAAQLQSLNVGALCVPGKSALGPLKVSELNELIGGTRSADRAMGIGKTFPDYILQNKGYYAACPAVDDNEIFTNTNSSRLDESVNDHSPGNHVVYASAQNMSTNALNLPAFDALNFFSDDTATMTRVGYNKASCLRAPGASCFSDYDCSPNSFISQKVRSLASIGNALSLAEQNFWKEELVCANSQERYLPSSIYPNPYYELNEHRCCRETGKNFTFSTQKHLESDFEVVAGNDPSGEILLPGVNQSLNSSKRYSRTHTVYDKLINERSKYPPLYAPGAQRNATLTYDSVGELLQYNTLHLNNSRMCCTGHWVRNFASGTNGNNGGHRFSGQTQQNINKSAFKTLNWEPNNDPPLNEFENYTPIPYNCTSEDYQTADCEIKNIAEGSVEETKYLKWFGKLELLGIPQVMIETNLDIFKKLDESDQTDTSALGEPLPSTIKDVNGTGVVDATLGANSYYSAASYDNFEIGSSKLKKVFSEDSFACCVPTGIEVDGSMPDTRCCSGQINTENRGQANETSRCCLNDFADLSVYTNRYVSSEGAYVNGQPISDSDIDPTTGYIRKEVVLQMAGTMCCSGAAAYGVALGDYFIPMEGGGVIQNAKTRRWLYLEDLDNANEVGGAVTKFNAGMKWNDHVYCVPQELAQDLGSGSSSGGSSGGTGSGASQD